MKRLFENVIVSESWRIWVFLFALGLFFGCFHGIESSRRNDAFSTMRRGRVSSQKVIIFVHGLAGDPVATWTHPSGRSWCDLMDDDPAFQDFDRVALSFSCNFLIEEVADTLLKQIDDEGFFIKYKEIYFIAHSMGGLIVKRMLIKLNVPKEIHKLRRVKAALFVATPTHGAPLADFGSLVGWCSTQVRDLLRGERNSFIQAIENDWVRLMNDRGLEKLPLAYGAYEKKSTFGFDVVTRTYAGQYDVTPQPIDEDHFSIVKPANTHAQIYKWAKSRIQDAQRLAQEHSNELTRVLLAKDSERLTRDYPLGWALFQSSGRNTVYTLHATPAIPIHAGSVRNYLVSPGVMAIRIPSFIIPSMGFTVHSSIATIRINQPPFLFGEFERIQAWVEPIFYDSNNFTWVWGFREAKSQPAVRTEQ